MSSRGLSRTRRLSCRANSFARRFESLERRDLLTVELLHDINPNPDNSNLISQMGPVVEFNGAGYFVEAALSRAPTCIEPTEPLPVQPWCDNSIQKYSTSEAIFNRPLPMNNYSLRCRLPVNAYCGERRVIPSGQKPCVPSGLETYSHRTTLFTSMVR